MSAIRVAVTRRAARLRAWCLASLVLMAVPAVCSAALEDAWNATKLTSCASCHGVPISPTSVPYKQIFLHLTERFSTSWCQAGHAGNGTTMCSSYGSYFSSPGATDLSAVYDFVVGARDAVVTGGAAAQVDGLAAFAATDFGSSAAAQLVTITNYRDEALEFQPSITANSSDFSVVNGNCTVVSASPLTLRVGAATVPAADMVPTSCNVSVGFQPAVSTTAARVGSLRIDFTSYSTAQPRQRNIDLSGTARFAVYSPSGFAALTSPGFSAATDSSQTICRTISNPSTTTASLSIALSIGQALGASADYSNYYELDGLGACPGGSPALCVPANASVTGSTSLAAGASCSLPIKFNPGKFGFAGGAGARSAQLTLTHNYPTAGQTAGYTLVGNATTGPQPQIGISTSPAAVAGKVLPAAFASQVIGTTSNLWNDFAVSNSGSADGLDITQVTLSNPTEFALTENCVAMLPLDRLVAGSPTCAIGLTFTPATPAGLGQRCTNVTIRAAFSGNGDQVVVVCGTGVPLPVPQISVTPGSIAFGTRSIGAVYLAEPLVIANAAGATADLLIGAVTLNGSGFEFVPDAAACQGKTLAAGSSCTLQLQFAPDANAAPATYSATVSIASNDPTTPHRSVVLSATSVAHSVPALQWQPASTTLSFPDPVIAGQQSAQPLVIKLANVDGPGAVDVQAVRLVGADASSFAVSSCPALLYQGESCDVSVRFLPGSGGLKTAQLQVVSANGVAPPVLAVQGQGVGGSSAYLIVSADTLPFGRVRIGARSEPLVLTLAAGGDGLLTVTSLDVPAPFALVSRTCPPVPFTLTPGSDCSVEVTFEPTSTADMSATLSIGTDASAQPLQVSVNGAGQERADVSGGGCSLVTGASADDPTLWVLVVLALAALLARRRHGTNLRSPATDRRDPQ